MAQENQDKFQASLTIETDIAADQVTLKHYAGIDIASIQRDPDAGGLIYTFELTEPVPDGEEIVAVHGYQLGVSGPPPILISVHWLSPTLRQLLVTDYIGGSTGIDFHVDLTFYRRHNQAAA